MGKPTLETLVKTVRSFGEVRIIVGGGTPYTLEVWGPAQERLYSKASLSLGALTAQAVRWAREREAHRV